MLEHQRGFLTDLQFGQVVIPNFPRRKSLGEKLVTEVRQQPLTTRRATRLVLKRPRQRTDEDTQLIAHLQAQHHELAVAIDLAQDFCAIVRERQADRFITGWRTSSRAAWRPCSALPQGSAPTMRP